MSHKSLPAVGYLKIPEDGDPYLEGYKCGNCGAIFLGEYTPEVFGDYCAGSNDVLPTVGSAKFSSPLGVQDFVKRSNIIKCSEKSSKVLAEHASVIANAEGLFSHKESASFRKSKVTSDE